MLLGLFHNPVLTMSRITWKAKGRYLNAHVSTREWQRTPGLLGAPVLSLAVNGLCRRIRVIGPFPSPSELPTLELGTCSAPGTVDDWSTGTFAFL